MRTTHPDGNTDLFMHKDTQLMAELETNGPGWVTIGILGSNRALNVHSDEWDAFVELVGEINEQVRLARIARLALRGKDQ